MSRQFSIPTVLRMVPNELLAQFFTRLELGDLDIKWDELGEREIDPILKEIGELSRAQQDTIEGALRSVFDLACETGIDAIFEAATKCGDGRGGGLRCSAVQGRSRSATCLPALHALRAQELGGRRAAPTTKSSPPGPASNPPPPKNPPPRNAHCLTIEGTNHETMARDCRTTSRRAGGNLSSSQSSRLISRRCIRARRPKNTRMLRRSMIGPSSPKACVCC